MKTSQFGLFAAMLCVSLAPLNAQQDQEPPLTAESAQPSPLASWGQASWGQATWGQATWGMETAEIPSLLRLHCPVLVGDLGVLVDKCHENSLATRLGLQPGDVILEINGLPVSASRILPPAGPMSVLIVLRRGQPTVLTAPPATADLPIDGLPGTPWRIPDQLPSAWSGGVTASSFATGNQAISVSRAGNQVSIEIADPEISKQPLRFSGTPDQIEQQLQRSSLNAASKQTVRQALGR